MQTQQIKAALSPGRTIRNRPGQPGLHLALVQLDWSTLLTGLGLFGLFVGLFASIQFASPNLAGNDGYYHIRLAQVMREQGLRPAFPWLPLTILNPTDFVDHHFLFHVLLIPFTYGDLLQGAKWASVVLPAVTFVVGWILLRGQRVPYPALWSVGLFAMSEAFLYRMSMPRAQSTSLLVLLLALHLTLTRRYRWLLLLGLLYVWLYDAFPLLLALVGLYVMSRWLIDRELNLKPLLYASVGTGLGLVINPYFPDNLIFIYHHLLPKLAAATATRVGNEWYPYETWTLVENSGPALLAFVAGAVALGLRERRMGARTLTSFLLAILFGVMLLKSRRFVEYFPAFALVFAALAWKPLVRNWLRGKDLLPHTDLAGDQVADGPAAARLPAVWRRRVVGGLMVAALIPALWFNLLASQDSLRNSKPYQRFAAASAWLQTNTPAGSRVFQTDWDDFTRLYFYNTSNIYTVGLDPTYMQSYDAELYELWVDIGQGRVEKPAKVIFDTFGASYVLSDLHHQAFLGQAEADPALDEVYRDEYAAIFRVVGR